MSVCMCDCLCCVRVYITISAVYIESHRTRGSVTASCHEEKVVREPQKAMQKPL